MERVLSNSVLGGRESRWPPWWLVAERLVAVAAACALLSTVHPRMHDWQQERVVVTPWAAPDLLPLSSLLQGLRAAKANRGPSSLAAMIHCVHQR